MNPNQRTMQPHVSSPVVSVQQQPQVYVDVNYECVFPVRRLKIFGIIQIVLGIILGILSIIGIIIDVGYKCPFLAYINNYELGDPCFFVSRDLTRSGWFILAGCLPMCMSHNRQSSWRCLKIAFMVCSIISAAVFVPTVFGIFGGTATSIEFAFTRGTTAVKVLSVFIFVLSFVAFVVSIVAASYCCCYTKWDTTSQQGSVIIGGQQSDMIIRPPQSQIQVTEFHGSNMQSYDMTTGTFNQQQRQQQGTYNPPQSMSSAVQDTYVNTSAHEKQYGSKEQLIPSPYKGFE